MGRGSGKRIRDAFFEKRTTTDKYWYCRCGTRRKEPSRGYENFVEHVRKHHSKDLDNLLEDGASTASESRPALLFYKKKTLDVYGWLRYIIMGLQPFYAVENKVVSEFSQYGPISYNTLMKYMDLLTTKVEEKVKLILPDKLCLVFDGWSSGSTHYVGIFATFPAENERKYEKVLIGFSPLEDETNQTAHNHCDLIRFVLNVFGKSVSNVIALTGDNCNTNKAIANQLGVGFIGCASHRFNIFVKQMILQETNLIESIREIMKKLSDPLMSAKLRKFTQLRPILSNVTRWSSTANMLMRFLDIKEPLNGIDDDEIDKLMPNPRNVRKIEKLCETFKKLDSVTKALQDDGTDLADVRGHFDTVIEDYPDASAYLGENAEIVGQPKFESGIVKILNNQIASMDADEKTVTNCLIKEAEIDSDSPNSTELSITERARKKRKLLKQQDVSYIESRFLLPTSNICERFFSTTGYALGDRRMSINPANFEQQMFLFANSEHWDITDVNSIVNDSN